MMSWICPECGRECSPTESACLYCIGDPEFVTVASASKRSNSNSVIAAPLTVTPALTPVLVDWASAANGHAVLASPGMEPGSPAFVSSSHPVIHPAPTVVQPDSAPQPAAFETIRPKLSDATADAHLVHEYSLQEAQLQPQPPSQIEPALPSTDSQPTPQPAAFETVHPTLIAATVDAYLFDESLFQPQPLADIDALPTSDSQLPLTDATVDTHRSDESHLQEAALQPQPAIQPTTSVAIGAVDTKVHPESENPDTLGLATHSTSPTPEPKPEPDPEPHTQPLSLVSTAPAAPKGDDWTPTASPLVPVTFRTQSPLPVSRALVPFRSAVPTSYLASPAVLHSEPLPTKKPGLPTWMLSFLAATLVSLAIASSIQKFTTISSPVSTIRTTPLAKNRAPLPTPPIRTNPAAPPAIEVQDPEYPYARFVEVTGLRVVEHDNRAQVQYLVVNHSSLLLSDIGLRIMVSSAAGASPQPLFELAARVPSLGAHESKEIRTDLDSRIRFAQIPEWENLKIQVKVISQQ